MEPFTFSKGADQVVWPDHCVKGTKGVELRPSLDQSNIQYIVRKGMDEKVDSYSAFFDNNKQNKTGLCGIIQSSCEKVEPEDVEIYIVGIATDVCVLNTALDARILNWEGKVSVIKDACAGVTPEGSESALKQMATEGIEIITSKEV
jgi:nicotinamidase/pyrazinamidase